MPARGCSCAPLIAAPESSRPFHGIALSLHSASLILIKALSLHAASLNLFKTYLHVEELNLGPLEFSGSTELARLLISLPCLRRLECTRLYIVDLGDFWTNPTGPSRFRGRCLKLSEVTVGRPTLDT